MKTLQESIIGRKGSAGSETIYVIWPAHSGDITNLERKKLIQITNYNTIFVVSETDLKKKNVLNGIYARTDACFWRSENPDTVLDVAEKLKDFKTSADIEKIGFIRIFPYRDY